MNVVLKKQLPRRTILRGLGTAIALPFLDGAADDGLHRHPVLHRYAEDLWKILKEKNPMLHRKSRWFSYKITFDIDEPYSFKGKSMGRMTAWTRAMNS